MSETPGTYTSNATDWHNRQAVIKSLSKHLGNASQEEIKRVVTVIVEKLSPEFVDALNVAYGVVDEHK